MVTMNTVTIVTKNTVTMVTKNTVKISLQLANFPGANTVEGTDTSTSVYTVSSMSDSDEGDYTCEVTYSDIGAITSGTKTVNMFCELWMTFSPHAHLTLFYTITLLSLSLIKDG